MGESKQEVNVVVERLATMTDDAHQLLREYYEAIDVVVRDEPGAMEALVDGVDSGMWVAFLDDQPVGCVVLRELPAVSAAAECKRLYVRPTARGLGIADKLLDQMEAFAAARGFSWIYLDSKDDLKPAIALYQKRGYELCDRYNDNPQATIFMRLKLPVSANRSD